jgi:Fe2+ or Zn2+ uptake regulation protein
MNYVAEACDRLRAEGLRVTGPRTRVLELLDGEHRALSPYEIRDHLGRDRIRMDVVTIYRVLEVLERLGLVHRVYRTGGYVRCRRRDLDHHHHHLVCTGCGRVAEITGDRLDEVMNRAETDSGYRVAGHILELYGLCGTCREASRPEAGHDRRRGA